MSRKRSLRHPRTIAWATSEDGFVSLSEELAFNFKPVTLRILHIQSGYRWSVLIGKPTDNFAIDTGGPCATLAEAQTAAAAWYAFARSR